MAGRISWFPGHMHKALKEMHRQLKAVDLVMEVRDARVPFSAANPELDTLLTNKRRVLVLNKSDLADVQEQKKILRHFEGLNRQRVFFTCAQDAASVRKLLEGCRGWLKQESSAVSQLMMVVGLPNTGKSSLINRFRQVAPRSKESPMRQRGMGSAKTGPTPGVTRQLSGFKVGSDPSLHILDTPGVMQPSLASYEAALRLGLTAAFKDSMVGEAELVRYLIGRLAIRKSGMRRKESSSSIVRTVREFAAGIDASHLVQEVGRGEEAGAAHCTLSTDALDTLLAKLGLGNEQSVSQRQAMAQKILSAYRIGALGCFSLDDMPAPP
mmetsp:Transcript_26882/g.68985  ORF Transcript_26882/g.68985 Transcript_26882/m.68985 type:complete len:325 (-) Transcript_26882:280-1254(-)